MTIVDEGRIISRGATSVLCAAGFLVACAGGAKPAGSAGTCPAGTVLRGSDCLPSETAEDAPHPVANAASHDPEDQPPAVASSQGEADASVSSGGESAAFDKEAVDSQLKRAPGKSRRTVAPRRTMREARRGRGVPRARRLSWGAMATCAR